MIPDPDTPPEAARSPGQRRHTRPSWRSWLVLTAATLLLTSADQWSKIWAEGALRQQHGGSLAVHRGEKLALSFTYVRNRGAAWGFLADADESFRGPFFFVISVAAIGFILFLFSRVRAEQRVLAFALALVLSGAVGNFIDRARLSYVIDFIDVRYGTLRWPTFNIADIAISVGVGLLFLESFLGGRSGAKPPEPAQDEG